MRRRTKKIFFHPQANKENNIDVYLFGIEEQEYLKDTEQINVDKQKHVSRRKKIRSIEMIGFCFQWDEYYRKTALKQRRGSVAFRMNFKSQLSDNQIGPSASILQISSAVNEESTRNGYRSRDEPLGSPILEANPKRISQEEHVNGYNDSSTRKSKTMMKPIRSSSAMKNESPNNEKSSTTCTIQ